MDNYMAEKNDIDMLHERCVILLIVASEDDMANWLAKIVGDVDSLHVEIEKSLMHASGVLDYKKYRFETGTWCKKFNTVTYSYMILLEFFVWWIVLLCSFATYLCTL